VHGFRRRPARARLRGRPRVLDLGFRFCAGWL